MATTSRPTQRIDWANAGTYVTPDAAKIAAGWIFREAVPFEYMNFLNHYAGMWGRFFDELCGQGVIIPGPKGGLIVAYNGPSGADQVFDITEGALVDWSGRKIVLSAGTNFTTSDATPNAGATDRHDAICVEGDDSADNPTAPTFTYHVDIKTTPIGDGKMPLCYILVSPGAAYTIREILQTAREDSLIASQSPPMPSGIGGNTFPISDGITTFQGNNVAELNDLIKTLNARGGGVVQLGGARFTECGDTIRLMSGVILDGLGSTVLHAGDSDSGQVCPMVKMEGVYQGAGSISDGYKLTYITGFSQYGIGSVVRISSVRYQIDVIDETGITPVAYLLDETGERPALPNGACTFDLFITGAGLRRITLEGANLPHAAPSDCVLLVKETWRCMLDRVDFLHGNGAAAIAAIQTALLFQRDNYALDASFVNVLGEAAYWVRGWYCDAAALGEEENWNVHHCRSLASIKVDSTGAGRGCFTNNDWPAAAVLPGAQSGWLGNVELNEHEIDGGHSNDFLTPDMFSAALLGDGLTKDATTIKADVASPIAIVGTKIALDVTALPVTAPISVAGGNIALNMAAFAVGPPIIINAGKVDLDVDTDRGLYVLANKLALKAAHRDLEFSGAGYLQFKQRYSFKAYGGIDAVVANGDTQRYDFSTILWELPVAGAYITTGVAWKFTADEAMKIQFHANFNLNTVASGVDVTQSIYALLYHKRGAATIDRAISEVNLQPSIVNGHLTLSVTAIFDMLSSDFVYAELTNQADGNVNIMSTYSFIEAQEVL